MPLYNNLTRLFPSYNEDKKIVNFLKFLEKLSNDSRYVEFYISIIGIVLTVFHITVLTRKSMKTTSIISIMIIAAICDLVSMIISIATRDLIINSLGGECTPPISLLLFHLLWVLTVVRDDVIRCSTWLIVVMALIRYLVSKYIPKSKFKLLSQFNFGYQSSFMSFIISTFLSVPFYLCVQIVQQGTWNPDKSCSNYSQNAEVPLYGYWVSDLFSGPPLRIFQLINGALSKLLPCLLLPVLTALLAVELKRTERNRNSSTVHHKNNTEKTTILVIIMTFLIFISSIPTGIATLFQVVHTDLGFLFIFIYVDSICNGLLLFDASLNCFICFAMSSQYRKAVEKLLNLKKPEPHQISPHIISMGRNHG